MITKRLVCPCGVLLFLGACGSASSGGAGGAPGGTDSGGMNAAGSAGFAGAAEPGGAGSPSSGGMMTSDAGAASTDGGLAGALGGAGASAEAGSAGSAGARTTGRDYYCDPVNGLPSNPGTRTSPWRRLEEVFSTAQTFADGDVIHLLTGNHGSPVIKGALASGARTISAEAGQAPVLKGLRFAAAATHWTVDGVLVSPQEADATLSNATLVQFDAGATNDVLQNSQLRYAPDAIASTWDNAAWIKNSGTAVFVVGTNNQILGNKIRNTHVGIELTRTDSDGHGATDSLVRGNSVDHFWEDAYRARVSNCTFEYNSAVNSYAVVPPGTEGDPPHRDMLQSYRGYPGFVSIDNVVVRGNVFIARQGTRYGNVPFSYDGHYTIQGLSAFDGPYSNWTIENNVVMVEVGLAIGLLGMNDSKIVNNTVVPDALGTDSEIRLTDRKDGTPSRSDIVRNNLVHTLNIGAALGTQQSNNLTIATGAYGTYFLGYAAGDVHLKQGSPAIGAGTLSDAPALDAAQLMRSAPYDVGAYEFLP